MGFMEKMERNQKSYTENGAVGYVTTGHKLVDLNFAIPSFRNGIDKDLFELSLSQDEKLTLKWLLYLRDVRQGIGERKSFRDFVKHLAYANKDLAKSFLSCVPIEEYGRWDDYVDLLDVDDFELRSIVAKKIFVQWTKDLENFKNGKSISLLAKWLPSENASSEKTKKKARFIRKLFSIDSRTYRKTLSMLRKHLDVVECKMSANNWSEIKYEGVPSKANLLYSDAFFKHDEARRKEYLESLKKGETKINAQALFLHDIVHKYKNDSWTVGTYDETLEQMWKAQEKVEGFGNTIVVRDGSGSMICRVGNSFVTALTVADAITLYCAENNTGEFKNKFITFSSKARLIDVSAKKTLRDKLRLLTKNNDCSNTNIENVFNLILDTAIKNNVLQEEMPKTVLIVSDMEFDMATGNWGSRQTINVALFESIAEKFREHGYTLPKLVFWNVNSRTNTIPLTQNESGVILLSGFSKNLMSMVMSSELDPYKALVRELETARYSVVDKIYE